ncbi:hypothetical protein MMC20_007346 [Loxospora ochrophaea]|nr:hypothetical protein [Loxospora ochrophaea]
MQWARDLKHSGSDIVVEEDLANVFGRMRISDRLTSSFKNIVGKSSSNISLWEGITLQGGPGPTVLRALQERPFFATVVQLSFLTWTFHTSFLAGTIADALQKRAEPDNMAPASTTTPSREAIREVLRACEDQTAAFDWNMLLHAVATSLGFPVQDCTGDLPSIVLQGALDMLPMVQTLPNDRFVQIQISANRESFLGICLLVVWAHHVLDFTVSVRLEHEGSKKQRQVRFGQSGIAQVVIEDISAEDEPAIILLDSLGEHLLVVKQEPNADRRLIGSIRRASAKGWGNALLSDMLVSLDYCQTQQKAVIEDLQVVTCAFAQLISRHLFQDNREEAVAVGLPREPPRHLIPCPTNPQRLLHASRYLFDNLQIKQGEIDLYASRYSSKPLDEQLPRPPAVDAIGRAPFALEGYPIERFHSKFEDEWRIICDNLRAISVFLIASAHIQNLEQLQDFMFCGVDSLKLRSHNLTVQLEEWNGRNELYIQDDAWLQAMAVPLLSCREQISDQDWEKICLISDRGWSAWISTFGDTDPFSTSVGDLYLGRGAPCRKGVWKKFVLDLQCYREFMTDPWRAEKSGEHATLRCAEKVRLETPFCGEGSDSFAVCARFSFPQIAKGRRSLQRAGYRELQ